MGRTTNSGKVEMVFEPELDTKPAEVVKEDVKAFDAPKAEPVKSSANSEPAAQIWVYIGPSVRGIVTNGSIFRGTRADVLKRLEEGIKRFPKIERFIVSDTELAKAKERLNSGKSGLSVDYDKLVREISEM